MKDRVPTRPNRKLITPENGGAAFYATVEFADEPLEEGTLVNKALADTSWLVQYTHNRAGSTHVLANADGGNLGYFVATAAYVDGDTFTVNGVACAARKSDGTEMNGGCFAAGAVVQFFVNGGTLTINVGGGMPIEVGTGSVDDFTAVSTQKIVMVRK